MTKNIKQICFNTALLFTITIVSCNQNQYNSKSFDEAKINGQLANKGFNRCINYVHAWLKCADPRTGLIPGNLTDDIDTWSVHNAAADNYPFMVLTSVITDSSLFKGSMVDILNTETKLTSRLGSLPDNYSFSKKDFVNEEIDLERIIFGSSEYVKDGLLPLTEWLGESIWSKRMINILDDVWANAAVKTKYGLIPSKNVEVNGEQLQILSRVYWMTGEKKYLDWAIRLGDYYLLDDHHPTRDFEVLRLRNHGCEIVEGLCELYATVNYSLPNKKKQYEQHIHEMLDLILEKGINKDGMFYNSINPKTGEIIDKGISDTWGYVYNGFYTVYMLDEIERYREAILFTISNLDKYRNYDWENGRSDGYADAIESAIHLYYREPSSNLKQWIDSQTSILWSLQDSSYQDNAKKWANSGIIDGDHCDGNFARTTIMYCLWKTQGVTISPWRDDVILGAIYKNNELFISIKADKEWEGQILFDTPRHKNIMKLPFDWPRINQFPEWYTINQEMQYEVKNFSNSSTKKYKGSDLNRGIFIKLEPDTNYMLTVMQL